GLVLNLKGNLPEAESAYRAALEGDIAALGDSHPQTAVVKLNLGRLLFAKADFAQAETFLRGALEVLQTVDPANPLDALNCRFYLAQSLTKLLAASHEPANGETQAAEAERLLLAVDKACQKSPGLRAKFYPALPKSLCELYETWHMIDPQAGHEAQAAEWR